MLTQVCNEWLTAKMPCSTKMWLEKLYRKRLITSALRKDLLLFRDRNLRRVQIMHLKARIRVLHSQPTKWYEKFHLIYMKHLCITVGLEIA